MQFAPAGSFLEHDPDKRQLLPLEDIQAMTFQVTLVGTDGLVVASDRMETYVTPGQKGRPHSNQRRLVDKFLKSDDGSVVCFYAGTGLAKDIARRIATKRVPPVSDLEWQHELQEIAEQKLGVPQGIPDEVIVVRRDNAKAAWLVATSGGVQSSVSPISSWLCTGDNSPARFLPMHLWRCASVWELKCLAALTLGYAAQENPSGVSREFDLMTLDTSGQITWETHYEWENVKEQFDEKLVSTFRNLCSASPSGEK
jgi:hypothetical protein